LELVKRLEGEVLEALVDLGGQEALHGLAGHTVDPRQFFGLDINRRAAAIAELVLWIGYLQWHLRTQSGLPSEPILKAFRNIVEKDAVLEAKVTLARGKAGKPITRAGPEGRSVEVYQYDDPRQPEWPEAEFIVGNPPFIGGKDLRNRLGDECAEALWAAHPDVNESADFVMYWWDPCRRASDAEGDRVTALRPGDDEFDQTGIPASRGGAPYSWLIRRFQLSWRSRTIRGPRQRRTPQRCASR
jgi:hypothetical protein